MSANSFRLGSTSDEPVVLVSISLVKLMVNTVYPVDPSAVGSYFFVSHFTVTVLYDTVGSRKD